MGRDRWAALVVLLSVAVAACGSRSQFGEGMLRIRTEAGTVSMRVEIADTGDARRRGLMGREHLASDSGMAFVFERPTTGGFWMKNTVIPLDIAFWAPGGRILAILHMTPCRADPCRLYDPGKPYAGAVEANQGFFERNGVTPGDTVRLDRSSA